MKLKYIIAALFILSAQTSDAQILKRLGKRLEDKIEKKADQVLQKAEDKVERKVDKKIDDVLNNKEKKTTASDNKKSSDTNKSSTENSNKELTIDEVVKMKGNPYENADKNPPSTAGAQIFKRGGVSRDTYNFSHYMKIRTRVSKQNAMAETTRYSMHFGVSPMVLSISDLKLPNGSRSKAYTLDRFVYDIDRKGLFTFTTQGKKKSYMGLEYDAQSVANAELKRTTRFRVKSVTKTGQSKSIAGYMCDAYMCEGVNMNAMVWISRSNGLNPYSQLYNIMNSSNTGGKNNMPVFYNHKTIKERLQAGAMVLAYELTDTKHNTETQMLVLSFGNKPSSFDAKPYKDADKTERK